MHTIEAISAAFSDENYDDDQLELLCLIANGHSIEEIAAKKSGEKEVTENAIRKRLGNIYNKMGIGGGKGKFDELNKILRKKLQVNSGRKKLLLTYFDEDEKNLAITLGEIISNTSEIDLLIINNPITSGKPWKKEVDASIEEAEVGIACFLHTNLNATLANSAIGCLSSSNLKHFRFVYFGGMTVPDHLSHFDGIDGTNADDIASIRGLLTEKSSVDEKRWIQYQFAHSDWHTKVLDVLKNPRSQIQNGSNKKLIENTTSLRDVLKLLDDETYQYEHRVINSLVNTVCPQFSKWLPKISKDLIQDMKSIKQEVERELLNQGFDVTDARFPKPDVGEFVRKVSKTLKPEQNLLQDFPIKVCVLRVVQENQALIQKGYCAADEISYKTRDTAERPPGIGFVQTVMTTGKPVSVRNMGGGMIRSFVNSDWIEENKLDSFMSFPVVADNKVKGTLSMYGDRDYAIFEHSNHLFFVYVFVNLISNLVIKFNKMKAMKTLLSLNREQFELLSSSISLPSFPDEGEDLVQRFVSYN